jgi:2-(1,2-epoxy-1,2-dihydrophenyl)acetyl-CoA isomerase
MADDRNEGLDRTKEPAVRVERAEDTAWITLNRPRVFNAFDEAMLHEMWEALRGVTLDRRVRVVVLRGAGPAFCAGGDLRAIMEHFPEAPGDGFHRLAAVFHQCILELRQMPKPVIAALHGPAAGGGFSMALACDLRLMAESAVLRLAYTSSGLCVDGGGTFNLPRLVGTAKALELALLDGKIDAETAARHRPLEV